MYKKTAQRCGSPYAYRVPHADGAYVGVGLCPIGVGTAAEGLGVGEKLHVGFNTNDRLKIHLHARAEQMNRKHPGGPGGAWQHEVMGDGCAGKLRCTIRGRCVKELGN